MQLERSEVAFFVYTNGSNLRLTSKYILKLTIILIYIFLRTNLEKRFELTDEALNTMNSWPPMVLQVEGTKKLYLDKATFQQNLTMFR